MAGSKTRRIENADTGAVLAERAEVADNVWTRFVGLMGRDDLPAGAGLLIEPCNSVHMFFMRIPLDIVHLDRQGVILRAVPNLGPWAVGPIVRGGRSVLELPVGTLAATGTKEGHRLLILDA